jgi:predicted TIM-barrel fold metal-dependent hydrolase
MSVVDLHAHFLPASLGEEFTRISGRTYRMRHPEDQAERIAAMDAADVDVQVIGLGTLQPYWPSAEASAEGARAANDLYASTVADHPRLKALGAVPLPHVDRAVDETVRCLDDLGFIGIGLGCSALETTLDDASLDPFWAALDQRGAVVHLHPGLRNEAGLGVPEFPMLLGPSYGSPAEEAIAVTRLAVKGTLTRFPNIKWVASSMGGALLENLSKFTHNLKTFASMDPSLNYEDAMAGLRSLWLDTSGLDAVSAAAATEYGFTDQLVLGSDAPWGIAVENRAEIESRFPEQAVGILERAATLI